MPILDDAHALQSTIDSEANEAQGQINAVIEHIEGMQSRIQEHQGMYHSSNLEAAIGELGSARDQAEELMTRFEAAKQHIENFVNSVMQ